VSQPENNRGWLIQWGIGIVLTAAAVFLLSRVIHWEDLKKAFASIPPQVILAAIAIYLISMGCRAWAWRVLLQRRVSFGRAWLGLCEGYFLNNILPFRLGEIGRAFLMGRRTGMGTLNTFSTVVVERAFDLFYAAAILLSTLPFVLKMSWARNAAILVLVLVVAGLFGLYLAARHREGLEAWLGRVAGKIPLVEKLVLPSIHSVLEGFSVLTRFEMFAISLVAMGLGWGTAVFRDWYILSSLSPQAPFWWALLAISASNLGGALPSMAASLGTFEGAATGAMVLAGASPEVGLAYALVIHVIHLLVSSIIGGIALSQEGESLKNLIADLRGAR
jgi:glycosyltransferase 2 family protein